jgi:hypothetical protein
MVRNLDSNGDIITSGTHFITGANEIEQTIGTRLKLFLGEAWRDINDGTPWFQQIFTKDASLETKEAVIRNRILRTEGVIRLTSFETNFDVDSRTWNIYASVLTAYGEIELSTESGL